MDGLDVFRLFSARRIDEHPRLQESFLSANVITSRADKTHAVTNKTHAVTNKAHVDGHVGVAYLCLFSLSRASISVSVFCFTLGA